MTVFEQLLQVQAHDTHLDQLRHRRDTLPERDALAERQQAIADFDAGTAAVREQRDSVARDQKRIEDEVATIEAKAADVDKKLYSGTITSPRELQGFQDDLQSLRRRQRQLEDDVLGFMEKLEPLDEELVQRAASRAALEGEAEGFASALAAAEQQLDIEIRSEDDERAAAASSIPQDLLDRYDKLRIQFDGVAIAPLVGSSCGGCHLTLSAMEVDRIKHQPADALIYCEECGRILVR